MSRTIRTNGQIVEVTDEVYAAYYQSKRRDRYYKQDIKVGNIRIDTDAEEVRFAEPKEVSFDCLLDAGVELSDPAADVETIILQKEQNRALYAAIMKLRPQQQHILISLYLANNPLSQAQYAERTGLSEASVRQKAWRARCALKKILEEL